MLIVLDFMLSLSVKSKDKLARATIEKGNLSVMYADQILSEEEVSQPPLSEGTLGFNDFQKCSGRYLIVHRQHGV